MFRKFEKVAIRWIKLSTFRATDPELPNHGCQITAFLEPNRH